jgi:hypothetical protein
VVLFADRKAYDRFRGSEIQLEGIDGVGHYGHGIVALSCTGRRREEIAATLAHELTHLLNRRALGPALPPWLDEGLAEDLALSRIAADGTLNPAGLSGDVVHDERTILWRGAVSSLLQTEEEARETDLQELLRLLDMDWEAFVGPASGRRHYRWSGLLVRFLAAESATAWRAGFQGYLRGIAAGGDVSGETLIAALDANWQNVWVAFCLWLETEAADIRAAIEPPERESPPPVRYLPARP